MFIEKENSFQKRFYAKVEPSGKVIPKKIPELPDAKRTREAISKLEKDGYVLQTVVFKMLSWGENSKILRECLRTDAETSMRYMDSYEFEMKKLTAVLRSWDFTRIDSKGEVVSTKPDENTIRMLYPALADFLLELYNEEGELSPEKEKNS